MRRRKRSRRAVLDSQCSGKKKTFNVHRYVLA